MLHKGQAALAEWLRRWTWNPMGSPRVGSNPAGSALFNFSERFEKVIDYEIVQKDSSSVLIV